MKLYKDPLNGNALMSYRGQSVLDAGYIYSPYIPLMNTPIVCAGFGASHKMIQQHAYNLWNSDIEPKYNSEYYWAVAQKAMVAPIATALADEVELVFVPGTELWPYHYFTQEGYKFVARCRVGDTWPSEDVFRMERGWPPNDNPEQGELIQVERFDLHDPASIDRIVDTFRLWASEATSIELPETLRERVPLDPNSFNPAKGILTRYGKKLLADAKKHYGKITFSGP